MWEQHLTLQWISLVCLTPWWGNRQLSQLVVATFLITSVPYWRNKPPICLDSGEDHSPRTYVEGQQCKTRGVRGYISRWFDEDSVKLCVIGIFVIVDAITIDKPADWCYIYHEQARTKNGSLWDTGAGVSCRHDDCPARIKNYLPERYDSNQFSGASVSLTSDWSLASSVVWFTVSKAAEILRSTNATKNVVDDLDECCLCGVGRMVRWLQSTEIRRSGNVRL